MNFILQGFGVFLGVIAGVIINIAVQSYIEKSRNKKSVQNLFFEFELNIKKIEIWLEEIRKYRNAVNSDTMNRYFGYIDFSKFVTVTANNMFASELLYNYLSHEHISSLQEITSYFSINGEKYINDQIAFNKKNFDIKRTIVDVGYHEEKIKTYKNSLLEIMGDLKDKL